MQYVFCSQCGTKNNSNEVKCEACGQVLYKPESELPSLKNELIALKKDYETKFSAILARIENIEKGGSEQLKEVNEYNSNSILPKIAEIELEKQPENDKQLEKQLQPIAESTEEVVAKSLARKQASKTVSETKVKDGKKQAKQPRKSILETAKSIPVLSIIIEEITAPITNIWEYAKKTYDYYKEKNQLPVFFMMLAGISILLFGFGYLMQLSVSYFGRLSEIIKILFGFACSTAIIFWAVRLYRKSDKYNEFSSALLSLSIGLNYIFIYFLANLPNTYLFFSSPATGFLFIIFNTVLAIFFALKYETKIVAVLSLLCGAFTPFYLNSDSSSALYFAYLWLLCLATIYVARKIKWETLGTICFLTAASVIELAVFSGIEVFPASTYSSIFHAFAFLFIGYILFDGKKIREEFSKSGIVLLAATLSLFLFNLYYLYSSLTQYTVLGYVYLANAIPFLIAIPIIKQQLQTKTKVLLLGIAATFVAFAIPAIFNTLLMGLFWSVEALVLLFLGLTFGLTTVRKEGYLLLVIALFKVVFTFSDFWFIENSANLLSGGYFNLLIIGPILGLIVYMYNKHTAVLHDIENKLSRLFANTIALWLVSVTIITLLFFTYEWFAVATVFVAYLLIVLGFKLKLIFTQKLGYIVFAACVLYSTLQAVFYIPQSWKVAILTVGYINLLAVGAYFIALQLIHKKLFILNGKSNQIAFKKTSVLTSICVSLWFTALFLITGLYYIDSFTFNMAILPMFALVFIGHKYKFQFTEYLGLGYAVLIIMSIALSVSETASLRFSHQTLSGKIGMIELLFILYFLKVFYDKILQGSDKVFAMDVVREIFYWIVPLIVISPVKNHFPDYLPVAIWGAAFINYTIYEFTQRKSLIVEFTILAAIGVLASLTSNLFYLAIPSSLAVLAYIFIKNKAYKSECLAKSNFKHIFIPALYYLGACLFVVTYQISNSVANGLIVVSVYFSAVVIFRPYISLLKSNFLLSFWISLVLSALAIVVNYFDGNTLEQILAIIPLVPIGIVIFGKETSLGNKPKVWITIIALFHFLVLLNYCLLFSATWLTIAFTIHAIVVLFSSMKIRLKSMVWQSVALFGIAIIKLFFWDISHFTITQKVIVFVIIGGLLIGASFLYMKLKNKFEVSEKQKE